MLSYPPRVREEWQFYISPPVRWGLLDFMSVTSPPSPSPPSPPPPVVLLLVGSQLRSCEFSVACWTPTAILRVKCGVPDPNRDPASSVWRAGPQLWSREFSAVRRTSTAIPRVQCGVPDLNCDYASSVWRAGPHLWWKGLVVVAERVCQRSSCKMSQDKSDRMSEDMFARSSERMCQKEWSKICQECQKILLCLKEVQRECLGKVVRNMFKNLACFVFDMFVLCFRKHLCQVLYWRAGRTQQEHAKFQKTSVRGFFMVLCHELGWYVELSKLRK